MFGMRGIASVLLASVAAIALADEPAAHQRGHKALTTRSFNPANWDLSAYDNVWRFWDGDLKEKPADYDRAFRDRYGLHPAPFENGRYPMGVREGDGLFARGLTTDCMLCHGGSIMGKSYIGLGNSALELQAFFSELDRASGKSGRTPFAFSRVRGTNEAAAVAVFLLSFREPNLKLRLKPVDLSLADDLCEDVPAWWLLKKKQSMYHTGSTDARSVRSLMQFMMSPLNGRDTFDKEEATFGDIRQFLLSLEAPRYPFPIDTQLAEKGRLVFNKTCASCHGTYGEKASYPNKIVPLDIIGTDRTRFQGLSDAAGLYYNKSWFAQGTSPDQAYPTRRTEGYQAPPLDGIWATAPYLHNGSLPTVYHVLNSKARPRIFTRSYRTDAADYDAERLGWKIQVLAAAPVGLSPYEARKIYDTTQIGRGNRGHTFGDDLSDEQRRAVIEYLKGL